jgi:hypothetical protein
MAIARYHCALQQRVEESLGVWEILDINELVKLKVGRVCIWEYEFTPYYRLIVFKHQ